MNKGEPKSDPTGQFFLQISVTDLLVILYFQKKSKILMSNKLGLSWAKLSQACAAIDLQASF